MAIRFFCFRVLFQAPYVRFKGSNSGRQLGDFVVFCLRSLISSASYFSFLAVVSFMSSKFLQRWFSDCLISVMSESSGSNQIHVRC